MTHPTTVVLLGAGMANTFVLGRIVAALASHVRRDRLSSCAVASDLNIILVNADHHFAGGVAYGRSDACFLLNTPIALIEPKREFRDWLDDHLDWIIDYISTHAGNAGQKWLQKHAEALKRQDYAEICLPRVIYGMFLKQYLWNICMALKQTNERYGVKIQLEFLRATVESIRRQENGFILSLKGNIAERMHWVEREDGTFEFRTAETLSVESCFANFVSLGIGFVNKTYQPLVGQDGFFTSVYDPGMETIARTILAHPSQKVNVGLLGSKASALDVLYYVEHHPQLRQKVRIYAVSTSGQTRYPAKLSDRPLPYLPSILPAVLPHLQTADAIVDAVEQEIAAGEAAGYTRLEVWRSICAIGYRKIARRCLPPEEKRKFDREGEMMLRSIASFTDVESIEAFNHLKTDGVLSMIQGQIFSVDRELENSAQFDVAIAKGSEIYRLKLDVLINCMGATPLQTCHSSLITSIINHQLAVVNESGIGLSVNRDREASPNFFVVGPLTSGGEIENVRGEPEFHPVRHTMPYVLEDAKMAGKCISDRLFRQISVSF